ncbi:MAG: hypothetical protein PHE84_08475 [bacterium]|nr:hypothetical protein [bacterium]
MKIGKENGSALLGIAIFIAVAAVIVFVVIQMVRPTTKAGIFETGVEGITLEGMNKSDEQLQKEITAQATANGINLSDENIKIAWGPNRESLEITIDYSIPINLVAYKFDRMFNYYTKRELTFPKKILNQVDRSVHGSYDTMIDRARKATQDSGSPSPE